MAKIKSRIIDKNRYTKKYPIIRVPKRTSFLGDSDMELEILSISFTNESSKEASFEARQKDDNYRVLLSARDTTDSDSAQVTLSVDDENSDRSKIRVLSSAPFTGIVDVIVIRIS